MISQYEETNSATHCNMTSATHCNTLQHVATHCNKLQHTICNMLSATHCNILQHTAPHHLQQHQIPTGDSSKVDMISQYEEQIVGLQKTMEEQRSTIDELR